MGSTCGCTGTLGAIGNGRLTISPSTLSLSESKSIGPPTSSSLLSGQNGKTMGSKENPPYLASLMAQMNFSAPGGYRVPAGTPQSWTQYVSPQLYPPHLSLIISSVQYKTCM